MTALIDLGAAVLVFAGWFFAAIFVALFFAALFQGAKYRDHDEPARDVDYDGAYSWIEEERERREAATKRARARLEKRGAA